MNNNNTEKCEHEFGTSTYKFDGLELEKCLKCGRHFKKEPSPKEPEWKVNTKAKFYDLFKDLPENIRNDIKSWTEEYLSQTLKQEEERVRKEYQDKGYCFCDCTDCKYHDEATPRKQ